MNKISDDVAVVDAHAKIIDVRNLKMINMSVLTFVPPEHFQATVYMLAEKIANDIKNEF